MREGFRKFNKGIFQYPLYIKIWLAWLMMVNLSSIFFIFHIEAKFVLTAIILVMILMPLLTELNGFNKLLGLGHIIPWVPLLVYLIRPDTIWYWYLALTVWPVVLLFVASVISGSTRSRETE